MQYFKAEDSKRTSEFKELSIEGVYQFNNFQGSEILLGLDNIYQSIHANKEIVSTGKTSLNALIISKSLEESLKYDKQIQIESQ